MDKFCICGDVPQLQDNLRNVPKELYHYQFEWRVKSVSNLMMSLESGREMGVPIFQVMYVFMCAGDSSPLGSS